MITAFIEGAEIIALPFDITLQGESYKCTEILRLLPSKRMVVKAEKPNGKQLVIKFFAQNKKGNRELAREQRGHDLAIKAGVNVPQLLFSVKDFMGCCAIAYGFLDNAIPFANKKKTLAMHTDELLHLAAKLHQVGVVQADFHLGNILIVDESLFLIDLASVTAEKETGPLDKSASLSNLALLIVQFKPKLQQTLLNRLQKYYRVRGWVLDNDEKLTFTSYIEKAWQKRKTNYLSKRFRNCTMTAYQKTFDLEYAFRRSFWEKIGKKFVDDLDSLVLEGKILKAGNSATVAEVEYAGKKLVIKRYNIKNYGHLLKRCWRPSRAAVSWRNGCLLQLLGVATPKPLGFVEKRFGWFRTTAYLICERSGGQEISTVYKYRPPTEQELSQLSYIFTIFKQYKISHGDLKASNLLVKKKGKIQVIDLDAMQEHETEKQFLQAFAKDEQRFNKNWQTSTAKTRFDGLWP